MRFFSEFEKLRKQLEANGHEVIIPLPDEFYPQEINIKRRAMEDFNKNLKKSDAILVVNLNKENKPNHIGVNVLMEIGMAFILNKKIFILNIIPEFCKDELEAIDIIELKRNLNLIR